MKRVFTDQLSVKVDALVITRVGHGKDIPTTPAAQPSAGVSRATQRTPGSGCRARRRSVGRLKVRSPPALHSSDA